MILDNSLISTGGAAQFPDPYANNDMSWIVPTTNINYPSIHARGAAQIPQANAINVRSWLVPAIGNHIHSSHAGGAAQFPQAHTINDNSRPLMEGIAMNLNNALISAGGAGQFPEPYAIYDMSWLVPTTNIHYPSIHAGGAAQTPQANAINVGSWVVPAIGIHIPSSHARGAAQFPQAHAINDKSWPLMEGIAIILDNSLISARGAGQFPEPYAINDISQLVPPTNIHYPSNHTGGAAQIPQSNAINVGSRVVPAIGIHIPSSQAGGSAQLPHAHTINDKSRPLMEDMAMNLNNALISAGGADRFPDPNAINGMPLFVPTANINYPSNHAGGPAQPLQAHSTITHSHPLIEGAGPYSAFNLLLDKHHMLIKSEKLAWQLLTVPIDGFIDNEEATQIKKGGRLGFSHRPTSTSFHNWRSQEC